MTSEHLKDGFAILMCALLLTAFFMLIERIYPTLGKVVEVDNVNDTVCFKTSSGDLFEFYGAEDWEAGDFCVCIMDDRLTKDIKDDLVLDARFVKIDMFAD